MGKKTYVIDGNNFSTLEEFYDEISRILIPESYWGKNLDAFNDILYGGFGTPEEGFVLVWKNSEVSKVKLGFSETAKQLEKRLQGCHPASREHVKGELQLARENKGRTVFDWLVEIVQSPGHRYIELILD